MPEQPKPPVKWRVVSQIETTQPDASGRFVPGVLVSFQTESGVVASVFVPAAQYNVETVKRLINEKAVLIESVQRLSVE
jgi:molybdate-binding protein